MKTYVCIEAKSKNDIEKAINALSVFGITVTIEDGAATTKAEPKAQPKTSSKKKSDDTFDRDKYLSIAKELGCLGKKGVWKGCRPTVYKVMDGTLTKAKAKAEVKAFAEAKGWKLNK